MTQVNYDLAAEAPSGTLGNDSSISCHVMLTSVSRFAYDIWWTTKELGSFNWKVKYEMTPILEAFLFNKHYTSTHIRHYISRGIYLIFSLSCGNYLLCRLKH